MDYTNYVNPSIGGIGHLLTSTSPSVQSPHGAAVVAPLFRPGMKDGYSSDRIFGFTAGCAAVMPECGDNGPAELAGRGEGLVICRQGDRLNRSGPADLI